MSDGAYKDNKWYIIGTTVGTCVCTVIGAILAFKLNNPKYKSLQTMSIGLLGVCACLTCIGIVLILAGVINPYSPWFGGDKQSSSSPWTSLSPPSSPSSSPSPSPSSSPSPSPSPLPS